MKSESRRNERTLEGQLGYVLVTLVLLFYVGAVQVNGQSFSSGSDGSDGAYAPLGPAGTIVTFDPSQFHGSQVSANIFNFTSITIPAGVTVRLSGNVINGPVFWLAQGDVDIAGTLDLRGGDGHLPTMNSFDRVPSVPGAGGYAGGVGGNPAQAALPGNGPGGGVAGVSCGNPGSVGTFSGNQFLIPLIGGSGGGGGFYCDGRFGPGGGAGGGAILIASSTQTNVNGLITAKGGISPYNPGAGGGAIRVVSNTIAGNGTITAAAGGNSPGASGGPGRVRLEAYAISFSGSVLGTQSQSAPFPLLLPTAGPATAQVVSIGGTPIHPNPSTFPDITINTASPVPVVIQTKNIPTTATIYLTILNQNSVPDTVIQAPPLGDCDQDNFCTTTVNVVFPFGASRGLTKVTWTP